MNLEPLREEIISIYRAYREICERHQLRHWAAYGTAIGAVRHRGFIPWDDDFDVAMPNEDYQRFIEFAVQELPGRYKIVTGVNSQCPQFGFAKVQLVDRNEVSRIETDCGCAFSQGVYIDVFPLCGVPQLSFFTKMWMLFLRVRQYALERRELRSVASKVAKCVGLLTKWIPGPSDITSLCIEKRRLQGLSPFDVSEKVARFDWNELRFGADETGKGMLHDGKWFATSIEFQYENTTVPVPGGYHELLTQYYGDYMTPPPVDKRVYAHSACSEAPWKYGPLINGIV